MSQNITLPAVISPTQALALGALAGGSTVTGAAEKAGVARETVSRWLHRDPVFIAELQNARAELAIQTRCALEAIGMQSVAVLRGAVKNEFIKQTALKAACAVLKMLGADRAETVPAMTSLEVQVRVQEREAELRKRQSRLDANEVKSSRSGDEIPDSESTLSTPVSMEACRCEESVCGGGVDPAAETIHQASSAAVPPGAGEPAAGQPAGQAADLEAQDRQELPDGKSLADAQGVGTAEAAIEPAKMRSPRVDEAGRPGKGNVKRAGSGKVLEDLLDGRDPEELLNQFHKSVADRVRKMIPVADQAMAIPARQADRGVEMSNEIGSGGVPRAGHSPVGHNPSSARGASTCPDARRLAW